MTNDTTRDAFEVWANHQELDLNRFEEGYSDCNTENAWWAWQAATLAERERSAVELTKVEARLAAYIEDMKEGR